MNSLTYTYKDPGSLCGGRGSFHGCLEKRKVCLGSAIRTRCQYVRNDLACLCTEDSWEAEPLYIECLGRRNMALEGNLSDIMTIRHRLACLATTIRVAMGGRLFHGLSGGSASGAGGGRFRHTLTVDLANVYGPASLWR
jgi:hypothetical protein